MKIIKFKKIYKAYLKSEILEKLIFSFCKFSITTEIFRQTSSVSRSRNRRYFGIIALFQRNCK